MFKIKSGLRVGAVDVIDENGNILTLSANATLLNGQAASYYTNASNVDFGTLSASRLPALNGDVSSPQGSATTTLATVNSTPGTFGSSTTSATFSVDAKGRVTTANSATIAPAWTSITSKPVSLAGYGITDGQPLHAQLSSLSNASWTSGVQVLTLTAANTVTLKTVGSSAGNILDKASADSLYLALSATAADATLFNGQAPTYYTNASNLGSGTIPAARLPGLTGDIISTAGTTATTLATVNSNLGAFGSGTAIPAITVDGKGRIIAISTVALTPAAASDVWAGTNNALPVTAKALQDASVWQTVTYASTVTLDGNTGDNFEITLTGNTTLANPSNFKPGSTYVVELIQDTNGGRTLTLGSAFKFPTGADKALSAAAGAVDQLIIQCKTASSFRCSLLKGFA